jgi:hypothetical protein
MRLLEWRPIRKASLRGFCCVELPSGLIVRDVAVHNKGGRSWAALPGRPVLDHDGRHVSNNVGQKQYAAVLVWRDRELVDRFSARVVELICAAHPGVLDDEDAK